jgi:hypothetical protein
MNDKDISPEKLWEQGWQDHELAQLRRLARLPLSAKLEWLEQAHKLVQQLAVARSIGGARKPEQESS